MSKAEDLSQNRYPTMAEKYAFIDGYEQAEKDLTDKAKVSSGWDGFYYGQGYHQAEKDLELTVDDIMKLDALLIEMWNKPSNEDKYQEVLKRFKDFKEGKEK